MPPHFKSAHHQQKNNNNNNNSGNNNSNPAANNNRASFVENLFPDKFGKQHPPQQNQQRFGNKNNNNNNKSFQQQKPSWCHIPGTKDENGTPVVIPRLGVPVPLPPKSSGRRERSASASKNNNKNSSSTSGPSVPANDSSSAAVQHITFDRQVIKKINPIKMIPEREKPNYWFQEGMVEQIEVDCLALPIGSVNMIEMPGTANLRLVAWEKLESGATSGRVTLYLNQLPPGMERPDPNKMVALCSLNPFQSAVPLKIVLPAGPYILEARYCNKKMIPKPGQQQQKEEDRPKVVLVLETMGESFCLK